MANISVVLYRTTSPKNKVTKTLSNAHTFSEVTFSEPDCLNVRNPSILVKLSSDAGDISKYNYAKIGIFNRYYYIDKMTTEGGLVRIDLISDPLMSFKKDIYASTQYVSRSQEKRSPYLSDAKIPVRSDKRQHFKPFGNKVGMTNCPYVILETTGKGGTLVPD